MENVIVCARCGRQRPESTKSAFSGSCPYCLLTFALSEDDLAAEIQEGTTSTPSRLGPYTVLELLGAGGMGSVYKARHEGLGRIVALKMLKPEFADRPGFADRFQREGQMLAAISHPQIIGVHDLGCDGGIYYLAMEYVAGTTLRERLGGGRLAVVEATALFSQMCAGVQYAHQRGIVHCDIKPENVLIDTREQVKIADFGIAKLAGAGPAAASPAEANVVAGTRSYMAPEQLEPGRAVDQRADIYSLGVVFYEMLTGQLPLGAFAPPSHFAGVNSKLDKPILAALAKDPGDRPADAQTFLNWVEETQAQPAAAPASVRTSRRRWLLAALAVSAAIVLVILAKGQPSSPEAAKDGPAPAKKSSAKPASVDPHTIVLPHGARVWDVAFAPHEPLVASSGEDGLVKFWNLAGGDPVASLAAYPHGELGYLRLAFSPKLPILATAGGENVARLWDLPDAKDLTGKERVVLRGHAREIVAIAFSPDGTRLATASHDRTVKLWNADDGSLAATLSGHTDPVLCVAFSPDGTTVAAGSMNGAIKFWDARSFELLWTAGHSKRVWSLAVSGRDGLWISGSHDQSIKFFDLAQRKCVRTLSTKGTEVWSVAVSLDGERLASGTHDGSVRLWHIADGKLLATRKIHTAPVVSVAFSADGKHLASASLDQSARISETAALLAEPGPQAAK